VHEAYENPAMNRREFLAAGATAVATSALEGAQPQSSSTLRAGQVAGVPFRLGMVTYNIAATWDLPTIFRICRNVGISPVECRTSHSHGVEPALTADQRRTIRQQFADSGIEFWGCGSVCEFQAVDQTVVRRNIDQCKEFIRLAADLGGRGVKVRPNSLPQGVPVERTLEQIGRSLRECGQAAADAGIEIWVEVHGNGTSLPRHCKTMMEHADHRSVGLTWNSNQTDVENGSVAESFRLLRPWIKSCHINELHSGYPYRELFRLFRENNYDRVTLCEIQGMPDVATGERLLRYYKALWSELARG
jgi:sugar phosphate isomerase/epimerase